MVAPAAFLALLIGCDNEERSAKISAPIEVQGELLDAPAPVAPAEQPAEAPAVEVASAEGQFAATIPVPSDINDPTAYDFEAPPAPPPLLAAPPPEGSDPAASIPEPTVNKDGFLELTFVNLGGWEYIYPLDEEIATMPEEPDGSTLDRFPEHIRELNGKKISLEGFMIPADVIEGKVKSFILIKNQSGCCFGVMPLMNEWVYVTMAGDKTTEFMPDIPLKVQGEFKIGESVREGMVVSIYRMFGETVTAMPTKFDRALGF